MHVIVADFARLVRIRRNRETPKEFWFTAK